MKVVILSRGVGGLVASNLLVKKTSKTHDVCMLGFTPFPKECTEDEKIEASSPNS